MLIEEEDISTYLKKPDSILNITLQDPFPGIVKFQESEDDRFQILVNISGSKLQTVESVRLDVSEKNGAVIVHLKQTGSSPVRPDGKNTLFLAEEDVLYVQCLIIVFLSLVLLSFLSAVLYLCWWYRYQYDLPQPGRDLDYKQVLSIPEQMDALLTSTLGRTGQDGTSGDEIDSALLNATLMDHRRVIHSGDYNPLCIPESVNEEKHVQQGTQIVTAYVTHPVSGATNRVVVSPLPDFTLPKPQGNVTGILKKSAHGGYVMGSSSGGGTLSSTDGGMVMEAGVVPPGRAGSYTSSNSSVTGGPGGVGSNMPPSAACYRPRHIAREFLDESMMERSVTATLPRDECSVQGITHMPIAGIDYQTEFYFHGNQPPQYLHTNVGMPKPYGSDETSGILSDSEGSNSADRQNINPTHRMAPINSFMTLPLNKPLTINVGDKNSTCGSLESNSTLAAAAERYISLDANDQRYVSLGIIAEMANCPAHGHLLQNAMSTGTFPPHGGIGVSGSDVLTPENMPVSAPVCALHVTSSKPSEKPLGLDISSGPPGSGNNGNYGNSSYPFSGTPSSASSQQTVMAAEEFTLAGRGVQTYPSSFGTAVSSSQTCGEDDRDSIEAGSGAIVSPSSSTTSGGGGGGGVNSSQGTGQTTHVVRHSTSPRSALKGSRPPGKGGSNKQLRFTTLTLLGIFAGILFTVCAATHSDAQPESLDVSSELEEEFPFLKSQTGKSEKSVERRSVSVSGRKKAEVQVEITISLPRRYMQPSESNTGKLRVFRLFFNSSSQTELHLGPFKRQQVEIYDMHNANTYIFVEMCRERYACEHGCDPTEGYHHCICQRGYQIANINSQGGNSQGRQTCKWVGDSISNHTTFLPCTSKEHAETSPTNKKCTNCNGNNKPVAICLHCDGVCPSGYYKADDCSETSPTIRCQRCSSECPIGSYLTESCSSESNRVCQPCAPLCTSQEYELSPCTTQTNRICQPRDHIPGMRTPYRKNIYYENLLQVKSASTGLLEALPHDKTIILQRGSDYQIKLEFEEDLHLHPTLIPVNHDNANDNAFFKPDVDNITLREFCKHPFPIGYRMRAFVLSNMTSDAALDTNIPGYLPTLAKCRSSYRLHGDYPSLYSWSQSRSMEDRDEKGKNVFFPRVPCIHEDSLLVRWFGTDIWKHLQQSYPVLYEERESCAIAQSDCMKCSQRCVKQQIEQSLHCKPTDSAADNGRSPRLETCLNCCIRSNCTEICQQYATLQCPGSPRVCVRGSRVDIEMEPDWGGVQAHPTIAAMSTHVGDDIAAFLCHVQMTTSPVYRLKWSVLREGKPIIPRREEAIMSMSHSWQQIWHAPMTAKGAQTTVISKTDKPLQAPPAGAVLLATFDPAVGIDWETIEKEPLPNVVAGVFSTGRDGGSVRRIAAMHWQLPRQTQRMSSEELAEFGDHKYRDPLYVIPSEPLRVNTDLWRKHSHEECMASQKLLEDLHNLPQPSSWPNLVKHYLKTLNGLEVERTSTHTYRLQREHRKAMVNFTVPASVSILSAIFAPTYVERDRYLRASLSYEPPKEKENEGQWILEITGQVFEFPGLFRMQLWPQEVNAKDFKVNSSTSPPLWQDVESLRDQKPLLDYDVGVYDEKKFQFQLVIPAPIKVPNFAKRFLVRILDTQGTLDIVVTRALQIQEVAKDNRLSEKTKRDISDVDESEINEETSNYTVSLPNLIFGPFLLALTFLCGVLLLGNMRMKEAPLQGNTMFKRHLAFLFLTYMLIKAIYSFSVTFTALVVVLRFFSREQLETLSTENWLATDNATVYEQLQLTSWEKHLHQEIERQRKQVHNTRLYCDGRINHLYSTLEEKISHLSSQYGERRSECHISLALLNRAQEEINQFHANLSRSLREFNITSQQSAKTLQQAMVRTRHELEESEWLKASKEIYDEVVRLRRKNEAVTSNDRDVTKGFLDWAHMGSAEELSNTPALLSVPPLDSGLLPQIPNLRDLILKGGKGIEKVPYVPYQPSEEDMILDRSIYNIFDPSGDGSSTDQKKMSSDGSDSLLFSSQESWRQLEQIELNEIQKLKTQQQSSSSGNTSPEDFSLSSDISSFRFTWFHLFIICILLDVFWFLHRLASAIQMGLWILEGYPREIDCSNRGFQERKMMNKQPCKWAAKRLFRKSMRSQFVPKFCASAFTLLMLHLCSQHGNELISERTLELTGYYANLVLPLELMHKTVNEHIKLSAQHLNEIDLQQYERSMDSRYREAQMLLETYIEAMQSLEDMQCTTLLSLWTNSDTSQIPSHCLLPIEQRLKGVEDARKLPFRGCLLDAIDYRLLPHFNGTQFYMEQVEISRPWIGKIRECFRRILFVAFIFCAIIISWNLICAIVWAYVRRFQLLREKRMYAFDFPNTDL